VPWQKWLLWSNPTPSKSFAIEVENYQFKLPPEGIEVKAGEYVEFVATSRDVTYGFGAFREDGTLVFQMQVLPRMTNSIVWQFDAPGTYDVRSTEYSGPRHSEMFLADAIRVVP
jgi:cytochrome c oxidase subunit 2